VIVRIRVTQTYFYVLQRAFIRVDDVTIRLRETRVHHVFGSQKSLRQYTEREEEYAHVKTSCSQKQLSEGVLDEPDLLAPKLKLKFDVTEVLRHSGGISSQEEVSAAAMKNEIAQKNAEAEAAFKKKYGNMKVFEYPHKERERYILTHIYIYIYIYVYIYTLYIYIYIALNAV